MLIENKVPIDKIIKEVSGLNIQNKTALYSSIEDENMNLFEYLIQILDELNSKLNQGDQNNLIDELIYSKNKDGQNPFYAACLSENWVLFLYPLLEKMIHISKMDYFENYSPLRAAFYKKNLDLVDFLYSKGFEIDHYVFCQILESNLWNSIGKQFIEKNNDFQFDLFMPLHMIKDDKYIEQIFNEKRINLNFVPKFKSNYLLLSSIRDRNEKVVQIILNHCEKDKILFDWKDTHGKTSLHYAIENSMSAVFYFLVDYFTSTDSKSEEIECDINAFNWKNGKFSYFFIEDENKETPIHYLFKSFNQDFIIYFYKHSVEFLKINNKIEFIKTIFNSPILSAKINLMHPNLSDDYISPIINLDFDKYFDFLPVEISEDDIFNTSSIYQSKDKYKKRRGHWSSSSSFSNLSSFSSSSKEENKFENNTFKKLEFEGETLLTFSIINKNKDFIRFILQNIPEIDPNKENKRGMTPLQLAKSDISLFELLIDMCSQKVDSNKNIRNDLDVNKNNLVFHVFFVKNSKTRNYNFNLLMKVENFDFNQKKPHITKKGETKELFLIDLVLCVYNDCFESYLDYDNQKLFLSSPKLNLNARPDIIFKFIIYLNDNPRLCLSLFGRIDDDILKNARTDDEAKDNVATFFAKHYEEFDYKQTLIPLVLDKRVDFKLKNAEGKSAIDIFKENDHSELAELLLRYC